jgi:hypothetical protein
LGPRLLQLHIGNEADRFGSTIRDPLTWDARAYMEQWLPFARAVAQAVPDTKIGMPDISIRIEWFPTIVNTLMNDPLRERLGCLAHHHYIGGPPSNPYITVPNILKRDDNVLRRANAVSSAARQLGTVWRMTEGNSCFLGGKPGVSDVFAASLWMADYLLLLGLLGYAGANIHGGSGEMVASSLGGLLPGERLMADPKEPHNRPFYTPIAGGPTHFRNGPTYYGMQFASAFAGLKMVHVEFDPGNVNATAYAARTKDGRIRLAIINKDEHETLNLARTDFEVLSVLRAPSLTSKDISLERDESHRRISSVPPASAAILQTA